MRPSALPHRTHTCPRACPHTPPVCLVGSDGTTDYYRRAEGLDDPQVPAMTVWNSVIHASLKRKLEGLVAESPVRNGVSALLHASAGYSTIEAPIPAAPHMDTPPQEVVDFLLSSFVADALQGATNFIRVASQSNHVKKSSPKFLLLFVGDNESYRPLLRAKRFHVQEARFERSGKQCVISAHVWTSDGLSNFDFQLSLYEGQWLIDEVFRL